MALPLPPSARRSPPEVWRVERRRDWGASESGQRLRLGVVAVEASLRAGWLSVDWGVEGLWPVGLGVRSRRVLPDGKGERVGSVRVHVCLREPSFQINRS